MALERPIRLGNLANPQEVQILIDILRDIYRKIGQVSTPGAGGSNGDIQFNNGGNLDGFGDWDGSTLTVPGSETINSGGAYNLGDPATNGSWRIIRSGNNLSFQRREAGVWVEKSYVTP